MRLLSIALVAGLLLVGALHYAPLWPFALAIPAWLAWVDDREERRIRSDIIAELRKRVLTMPVDLQTSLGQTRSLIP